MGRDFEKKSRSQSDSADTKPFQYEKPGILAFLAGSVTLASFFLAEPRNPWPALRVLGMVYMAIAMYLGLNSEKVIALTGSRSAYQVNCLMLCGVKGVPMLALGFVCMLNELGYLSLY